MNTNWLDYTLLTLVIIGAINWGLIGFFRFDAVWIRDLSIPHNS